MANGNFTYSELRICVRDPEVTKVWVYIDADQNCPHMLQGWHYHEFPAGISSAELIKDIFETSKYQEPYLWTQVWPEEREYFGFINTFTYRHQHKGSFYEEKSLSFPFDDLIPDLIPDWASGKANGQFIEKAQLCTKDGRKISNAVILYVVDDTYCVCTDRGTTFKFSIQELNELFYPPIWIMKN